MDLTGVSFWKGSMSRPYRSLAKCQKGNKLQGSSVEVCGIVQFGWKKGKGCDNPKLKKKPSLSRPGGERATLFSLNVASTKFREKWEPYFTSFKFRDFERKLKLGRIKFRDFFLNEAQHKGNGILPRYQTHIRDDYKEPTDGKFGQLHQRDFAEEFQ